MTEILNRKQAPEFRALRKIEIAHAQTVHLDNGIPISTLNAGTQELVKIDFIFNAGAWYQSMPLQATTTSEMLEEGTAKRNAAEIAEGVDYYGAFLEQQVGQDWSTLTLYTLVKHIENVLPVLEDVITNPSFPDTELAILLQNKHQEFQVDSMKVAHLARTHFINVIFGTQSPYSYKLEEADFAKIKREHLVRFYKAHYNSKACKIIVSGNVNEAIVKKINRFFGGADWAGEGGSQHLQMNPFESSSEQKHFIEKADSVQSAIRIGRPLFNKLHADYHSLKVANTILGGYFGSRLMTNIRENKGYTYGIGSRMISMRHAGYFFISTEVGSDVCHLAVKEIYKELKTLQDELVSEDELELVKSYILGDFVRSIDGPFALADKFRKIMLYDLNYEYYDHFIDSIKNCTPAIIRDMANRYFNKKDMFELVVGKPNKAQ